jgi:methyl-accepting chemotaxis protein
MNFHNLKIPVKLGVAFVALIIISAVSSATVFASLKRIEDASVGTERSLTLAANAEEIMALVLEQQSALRGYVILGDPELAKTYAEGKQKFDAKLDAFEAKTTVPAQKARIAALRGAMADWRRDIGEPALALMADPVAGREEAGQLLGKKTLTRIRAIQGDLVTAAKERVAIRTKEAKRAQETANLALIIGGALSLAVAGLMGWLLSRAIGAPVAEMTATMRRLASGDNTVEVPAVGRKDEIGDMADAVVHFKNAAIEKVRLEAEAAEQRAQVEAERQQREREKAAEAEADAFAMNTLAQALDHLASGDLT